MYNRVILIDLYTKSASEVDKYVLSGSGAIIGNSPVSLRLGDITGNTPRWGNKLVPALSPSRHLNYTF